MPRGSKRGQFICLEPRRWNFFCSNEKTSSARLNKLRSLRRTGSPSEAHSAHLNIPAPWLLQMSLDPWILIRNEAQSERTIARPPGANGVWWAPNGKVRAALISSLGPPYWVRSCWISSRERCYRNLITDPEHTCPLVEKVSHRKSLAFISMQITGKSSRSLFGATRLRECEFLPLETRETC